MKIQLERLKHAIKTFEEDDGAHYGIKAKEAASIVTMALGLERENTRREMGKLFHKVADAEAEMKDIRSRINEAHG